MALDRAVWGYVVVSIDRLQVNFAHKYNHTRSLGHGSLPRKVLAHTLSARERESLKVVAVSAARAFPVGRVAAHGVYALLYACAPHLALAATVSFKM